MCLICIDFQKERMTTGDARRALREMTEQIGPEHAEEVREMITTAERLQQQQQQHAADTDSD